MQKEMSEQTTMTKSIKLVVVDLDGTLLNSKHAVSERSYAALRKASEQGVQIVLATGKTRYAAREIIEKLNLATPGIYLQGLAIHEADGTIRHQQTLDPSVARQVITFAEDRGFVMLAYTPTTILIRSAVPHMEEFTRFHEGEPEIVGPLQNILDAMPINKLIAVGDPQRVKALRWQLAMQLNGTVRLMQTHLPHMLEILPPGASKGVALRTLLREMNVPAEEALVIGDAENDIEMLKLAGIGVAVANADEKTREAADYVVASNDDDGVAEALERFVLQTRSSEESPEVVEAKDEAAKAEQAGEEQQL